MFTTRRQIFETCGNRASRGTRKRWDRRWLTNRARANHRSRLLDALLPQDGITTLKVGDVVQSFVLSIPRRRKVIDRGSAGIDFSERSVRPRNALRHPEPFYFTPCSAHPDHEISHRILREYGDYLRLLLVKTLREGGSWSEDNQ